MLHIYKKGTNIDKKENEFDSSKLFKPIKSTTTPETFFITQINLPESKSFIENLTSKGFKITRGFKIES